MVTLGAQGQLRDVIVQDSSSYETLYQAAQEAVRLACPLPLQHKINQSEVVIRLPMVDGLSR